MSGGTWEVSPAGPSRGLSRVVTVGGAVSWTVEVSAEREVGVAVDEDEMGMRGLGGGGLPATAEKKV